MSANPHWRVEVWTRDHFKDAAGESVLAELRELKTPGVESVRAVRGYLLSANLSEAQVQRAAKELFADPVTDQYQIVAPQQKVPKASFHRVEVIRKPGVMDSVANSVRRVLHEMDIATDRAASFRGYQVRGNVDENVLRNAIAKTVANETIENLFLNAESLPFVHASHEAPFQRREIALLDLKENELETLSKEMSLSLSLVEMKTIQSHYREQKRNPTDAELETLAQTWSEHCKHKTLTGPIDFQGKKYQNLLKETIFAATQKINAPWCISVFKDNAGIIEFDEKWAVCFKVETHNHPSAIEPYGGAGTGIGGVIRDVLGCGLGAKPIASTDVFCVGPVDLPQEKLPQGCLHPKRILKGVVAGVRDYGNRMGIPTVNGAVFFHEDYVGNPLVYCGNVGLMPKDKCFKETKQGDVILVVGGRTGRDGIHGATFSSVELHEESEVVSSTAVQIGDPITEKKVMEGVLRARDLNLFNAITDCGAGGLSSAVGEMGEELGAEVDLEKVPLKYPGLSYAEIWISEAQERMVLAVPAEKLEQALAVFAAEEVEATPIGKFTNTHRLVLRYRGTVVGDLDMHFLHHGVPKTERKASWTAPTVTKTSARPSSENLGDTLRKILASPNVASKEWIIRRYDHEVQGGSVVKPLVGVNEDGPSDAAVITPVYGGTQGIAIGNGMNPQYGRLDPYWMAASAIEESLRNVVAVGANPERTAILDNFSWGNCNKPENLGSLVRAAQACHDVAIAYGTPFISGKDSLNNEYRVGDRTIIIPPSLLISAIGKVDSVQKSCTSDFKKSGSKIALIGWTEAELGGSHYHLVHRISGGQVPQLDLKIGPQLLKAVAKSIQSGLVLSCHDLSEGGLAVALAEMAFSGGMGAQVQLEKTPVRDSLLPETDRLFSESNSRFLLEISETNQAAIEKLFSGLPFAWIGVTQEKPVLEVTKEKRVVLQEPIESLRAAWKGTLSW